MAKAVKAFAGAGGSVEYVFEDGTKVVRRGGTRAWRNNNPGNVRYVEANKWQGQIGMAGGFCVFADRTWGERAVMKIFDTYGRRGLTLEQCVAVYAPACENDVQAYVRTVEKVSGVSAAAPWRLLTAQERAKVLAAVFLHEGWQEGSQVVG